MYILCLLISIFLLHHKKLDRAQEGRSDEGVKYFCQLIFHYGTWKSVRLV